MTLNDLCDFINGGAWSDKEYCAHGIPVLKVSNLQNDGIDFNKIDYLPESSLAKYSKHILRKGDLVIATVGSHPNLVNSAAGRASIIAKNAAGYLLNQNAVCLRTKDNNVLDQFYLAYTGKTSHFQHYIQQRGRGAANQMRIAIGAIKEYELVLPSTKVQRKLASILSAYDALIENNLKRIKLLEELAQRTYEEWFVKFRVNGEALVIDEETGLPEGWERKKLFDIAEVFYGYPFKANQFNSEGKGTPIIRIRNIPNSSTNDFTTEVVNDKYLVGKGDLLIGMDGEFYINNWSGPKSYLVQRSCNLKCHDKYLHGYLSQAIVPPVKYFEATISGATVAHLGKMHLETIEVIIPGQNSFSLLSKFNDWLQLKLDLATQNDLLKQSRDILLPRLMNGTINVEQAEESFAMAAEPSVAYSEYKV